MVFAARSWNVTLLETIVGSVSGALSDTVSTPGSVHNDLSSASTFEDKRRENFSKGQVELDRRRQSLVDEQKRQEEEKRKKEAEEAAEREKQKHVTLLHTGCMACGQPPGFGRL